MKGGRGAEAHQLQIRGLSPPLVCTQDYVHNNLKNYLWSTMTQERLNHVMLLHTHKDSTDNIN